MLLEHFTQAVPRWTTARPQIARSPSSAWLKLTPQAQARTSIELVRFGLPQWWPRPLWVSPGHRFAPALARWWPWCVALPRGPDVSSPAATNPVAVAAVGRCSRGGRSSEAVEATVSHRFRSLLVQRASERLRLCSVNGQSRPGPELGGRADEKNRAGLRLAWSQTHPCSTPTPVGENT